jgi:hypothetical protein
VCLFPRCRLLQFQSEIPEEESRFSFWIYELSL